jgi:hypothetical protein
VPDRIEAPTARVSCPAALIVLLLLSDFAVVHIDSAGAGRRIAALRRCSIISFVLHRAIRKVWGTV